MMDDERQDAEEQNGGGAPEAEEPQAEETQSEETSAEEAVEEAPEPQAEEAAPEPEAEEAPQAEEAAPEPEAEEAAEEAPQAEEAPKAEERPRKKKKGDDEPKDEVIPGAHLEPDLVLEERREEGSEYEDRYADSEEGGEEGAAEEAPAEPEAAPATPLELAAGARYFATGKRKTAVARVIVKPGQGRYFVNGRRLEVFFPRQKLQHAARQPLEVTGHAERMDVVARIHGGGVAAQAEALRHGIARALVEADPNLRGELKRRGFLTRDPRVKERKKAGLKKARKRPQFSKR